MLPVYVIIAEAKSKIIESLRQLFAEAKIVELRGLFVNAGLLVGILISRLKLRAATYYDI